MSAPGSFERGWNKGFGHGERRGAQTALHDAVIALIEGGQRESEAYRIIEELYEGAVIAGRTS